MPARTPARQSPPVIAPVDGLRQRQRSDGKWRVWWEPTRAARKLGAVPVDLSHLRPGEAQRRASAMAAQWAAGAVRPPRGHSITSLILDYLASRHFTERATSTKASYRTDLRAIEAKWGPEPVVRIDPPLMETWYESLLAAKGATRARAILTMMSIIMLHAERRGWIPKGTNPCTGLGMKKPAPRDRVATAEELAALLATADTMRPALALALRLAQLTGQRATDIRTARLADFEPALLTLPDRADSPVQGYVWRLVRSKRGNAGVIPILDPATIAQIDSRLAEARAENEAADRPLILNGQGQPYSRHRLHEHFAIIRDQVAETLPSVASLNWRDQRRTVGVMLRAAGVGRDDVGDLLGNTLASSAQLAATYTPATATTTLRAVAAITQMPERKKA